jgi:hypothetical protein
MANPLPSVLKENAGRPIKEDFFMNPKQEVRSQDWFKAAASAAVFLIVIFFLVTRSSCSPSGSADITAEAPVVASTEAGESDKEPSDTRSAPEDAKKETESPASPEKKAPETDSKTSSQTTAVDSSQTPPPPATVESGENPSRSPSAEPRGQSIGGMNVKGERLGVILDVSGSMSRYLESLRTEINSRFKGPVFLEVEGCYLEPSSFDPAEIRSPRFDNPNLRESVMNAIRELVEVHQVDSVYWFCDLQDERTEEALAELKDLARGNGGNSPAFHLYVRSTDKAPDPELENVISASGGAFEKRR